MRELKYRAEEAVQYEVRTKLLKHIITVPRTSVRTAMFCGTLFVLRFVLRFLRRQTGFTFL